MELKTNYRLKSSEVKQRTIRYKQKSCYSDMLLEAKTSHFNCNSSNKYLHLVQN